MSRFREIAAELNALPGKVFVVATGAGATFGEFFVVPGASKTLLGFFVPYDQHFFDEFAGKPDSYASPDAARKLAVAAYYKAKICKKQDSSEFVYGIGAACSIATTPERAGRQHKIHVALHGEGFTEVWDLILDQGLSREEEETAVRNLILEAVCRAKGVTYTSNAFQLRGVVSFNCDIAQATISEEGLVEEGDPPFLQLYHASFPNPPCLEQGARVVLFPGSFNPFHEGHQAMYDLATQILGQKPLPELSVRNADKPPLDYMSLNERVEGLQHTGVVLTRASKMIDKVRLFRKWGVSAVTFVVGADTWQRILDPRFLEPGELEEFAETDTKFLVFGRGDASIMATSDLRNLMIESEKARSFNRPVSSTSIRKEKLRG